jgi:hypothetical protein
MAAVGIKEASCPYHCEWRCLGYRNSAIIYSVFFQMTSSDLVTNYYVWGCLLTPLFISAVVITDTKLDESCNCVTF